MSGALVRIPWRSGWGDERDISVKVWQEGDDGPFYVDIAVEGKPELLGYVKIDQEDGSVRFYDGGSEESVELWPGEWAEDPAGDEQRAGLNRGRP